MIRYIKCPRCELNYIDADKQEVCDVCLKELKGIPSDIDEIDEDEGLATELCPVCGENMMRPGEKMCEECRKKSEYEEENDGLDEEDDEWREYLDDDTDAELDKTSNMSRATRSIRSPAATMTTKTRMKTKTSDKQRPARAGRLLSRARLGKTAHSAAEGACR